MIPPIWCCTMSLWENLSVSTAFGQLQGLVEDPSYSALHTLISLQSLRLGALLQLGSLWQQLLFIQHDKELSALLGAQQLQPEFEILTVVHVRSKIAWFYFFLRSYKLSLEASTFSAGSGWTCI